MYCSGPQPVAAEESVFPQRLVAQERYRVRVLRVVDGDTLNVQWYEGETAGVRVLGIDTPERGKPGFAEAGDYLRGRIGGASVELVFPEGGIKRDSFGRLLAEVWVGGGNLGEEMLGRGLAKVYVEE